MLRPLLPGLLGLLALTLPAAAQIPLGLPVPLTADAAARAASGAVTFSQDPLRSADIAVDASGGLHVAFVSLGAVGAPTHKPAVYGYCPAATPEACATPAGWTLTEVDTGWPNVRLALTPEGRPRLFLYDDRATVEGVGATVYAFAACDAGCASAAGWQVRVIGASRDAGNTDADRRPVRRFALDAEGRPRFVYYYGTRWLSETTWEQPGYLAACDADCAGAGDWRHVRLPDAYLQGEVHDLENAALAFGPGGSVRMAFALQMALDAETHDVLVYAECAAPCTATADWSWARPLLPLWSGPEDKSFTLATDASGRMHLAVKPIDEPLVYAWCDGDCLEAEWSGYPLALAASDGEQPALALDAEGRPRIAYKDAAGGLGYAWCADGCRDEAPEWGAALVEPEEALMAAVPIALAPGCTEHYWFGGLRPSLALDASGDPRVAYDGEYSRRCYFNPQHPEWGTFIERTWWTSRFLYFPASNPGSPAEPGAAPAGRIALAPPYPNPTRSAATIGLSLPEGGLVRLAVYDVLGREVAVVLDAALPAGAHEATLPTAALAPGRYLVRVVGPGGTAVQPLTVAR